MSTKMYIATIVMIFFMYVAKGDIKEDNFMLNYGLHIKYLDSVKIQTDYWQKFIVISLDGILDENEELTLLPLRCKPSAANISEACGRNSHIKLLKEIETNFTNKLHSTFKRIFQLYPEINLEEESNNKRKLRSPLDVVGNFAHWAFGITTDTELAKLKIGLKNTIEHLNSGSIEAFKKIEGYSSVIHLMESKMKDIAQSEEKLSRILQENALSIELSVSNLGIMSLMLHRRLFYSILGYNDIQDHVSGYENLITGKADPFLITPELFKNISNQIAEQLENKIEISLIPLNYHILYGTPNGKTFRYKKKLIFVKNFPLTAWRQNFEIYEVNSFKIPVINNSTFATQIENLPKFLIISQDKTRCVMMESKPTWDNQIFNLEHEIVHVCNNTCMSAIVGKNYADIKLLCKFFFTKFYNESFIYRISTTTVLLVNVDYYNQNCGNGVITLEGCAYCMKIIPCGCSIKTTKLYVPPQISKCIEERDDQKKYYAANIPFLSNFFSHDTIVDFVNISNMEFQPKIKLPDFNFMSNKDEIRVNLSVVAEKWKNEETFNLDEYEKLLTNDITSSEYYANNEWTYYDYFILSGSCLGIFAFSSLIFMLCKTSKMNSMLMAFSLLARNNVNALDISQFVYSGKTTTSNLLSTGINLPKHMNLYNDFTANILLTLILLILILYIVKICTVYKAKPNYFITKIFINVVNIDNSLNEHILLLKLSDTWINYNYFEEKGGFSLSAIGYLFPQLAITAPPTFSHKRYPLHQIDVPIVRIGLLQAAKLRRILSTPYFIFPYVQTGDGELISIAYQCAEAAMEPRSCQTLPTCPLPYSKYDDSFHRTPNDDQHAHESINLYPMLKKIKTTSRENRRKEAQEF